MGTVIILRFAFAIAFLIPPSTSEDFPIPNPTRPFMSPITTETRNRSCRPPFVTRVTRSICRIDSSNSFNCKAPPLYSLEKSSLFYQELIEVKEVVDNLKEDSVNRIEVAKFWDCNPFVPVHKGHVTLAEKKLTPGGHWLNIGKQAMKKSQLGFEESIATYAVLASGIFDGFISCWDAKYQYNYIRPITVIRKEFDENWEIPLYTPNFPEYPSGHSVISGVSSTILTNVFGDHYAYTDSSEVSFGMTVRHFDSFFDACDEAAISRLYGGIHFRSAIVNGVEQGKLIGESILKKAGII